MNAQTSILTLYRYLVFPEDSNLSRVTATLETEFRQRSQCHLLSTDPSIEELMTFVPPETLIDIASCPLCPLIRARVTIHPIFPYSKRSSVSFVIPLSDL